MIVNRKHVLVSEWLEIKAVARVIIRRDCLRIAIDHDRFVAIFAERKGSMATTVIKLNSLPDSVWTATQDDYFLFISRRRLVFLFVGGVKIGRVALELCGAGIHQFVNRLDAVFLA